MKSRPALISVDFKALCGISHEIGGFIAKIEDAKGVRKEREGTNQYSYSLHTSPVGLPVNGIHKVQEGIYQVCDICKWGGNSLQWNIYLIVIAPTGQYVTAEYLDSPNTLWVKEAVPVLKNYFMGCGMETVTPTPEPSKAKSNKWNTGAKKSKPKEVNTEPIPFGHAAVTTIYSGAQKGVFKIDRHNSKYLELTLSDGETYRFKKENGTCVTDKRYKVEFTL